MQKLLSAIVLFAALTFASCQKEDIAQLSSVTETEFASTDRGLSPSNATTETSMPADTFPGQVEEINFTDLPTNAQTWLLAHGDTSKIKKILKVTKPDGTVVYVVKGKGHKMLRFDADGNPIHGGGHGNGGPGNGGPGNGNPNGDCAGTAPLVITMADLPAAAQTWIATNAPTATVQKVVKITRPDCEVFYVVKFSQGPPVRFDADGNKI